MKFFLLLILFPTILFASTDNNRVDTLRLGVGTATDVEILINQGTANDPFIRFDATAGKFVQSNDGLLIENVGGIPDQTGETGKFLTTDGTVASWSDVDASPLTTKGDIYVYGTANTGLAIGTAGQVLTVDLAETTGMKWVDPAAVTPTTTQGDLIFRGAAVDERLAIGTTGKVLTSNGTTMTWEDPTVGGTPLMAKGSILTSNGTGNGEFDACADGEKLEWDSAEVSGVKCVTDAPATSQNYQVSPGLSGVSSTNPGSTPVANVNLTLTITTTGGPVALALRNFGSAQDSLLSSSGSGVCRFYLYRDSTELARVRGANSEPSFPSTIDVVGAGTYEYSFRVNNSGGTPTCVVQGAILSAIEIK